MYRTVACITRSSLSLSLYLYIYIYMSPHPPLSMVTLALGKSRSPRDPKVSCRGLTDLGNMIFVKNTCTGAVEIQAHFSTEVDLLARSL